MKEGGKQICMAHVSSVTLCSGFNLETTPHLFINSILGIQMPLVPTIFANVSILCMFMNLHARLKCLHSVVAFRVTSQIFFVLFKSVTHSCHYRVYALLERYRDHSYLLDTFYVYVSYFLQL